MKMAQDTMLAALDRVAEVQDELLEYERERSHYAASQAATASYSRELQAPLNAATTATRGLEQVIERIPAEVRETGRAYLQELNRALVQAQQALRHLEASR
jgi:signal transduction histidine kinase